MKLGRCVVNLLLVLLLISLEPDGEGTVGNGLEELCFRREELTYPLWRLTGTRKCLTLFLPLLV